MDRKIILASRSPARKALLKQIGLKFRTVHSKIREQVRPVRGCPDLVMKNALAKAEDVASRYRSGIVIGADTVVLAGKKIIGKPRNKKNAVATLKLLSRTPQWVYTGLAVVDIDNRKKAVACEKTKIYMMPLSDEQIKRYLAKVAPFDKAGSFDIQGVGGVFIDRIEGCYYNVVGLPLALLARLFKELGIDIF